MMNIRLLALQCLVRIENGGYSNLVLDQTIREEKLNERQASLLTALVKTTLEKQIQLEYILSLYLTKPLEFLDEEIRIILRFGLAQILFLDSIPAFAAVDESVKLTKEIRKRSASSLVNAVLRRTMQFDMASLDNISDETQRLSIVYSLNRSLTELIISQYPDEYEHIFKGMSAKRTAYFRVNSLKMTEQQALDLLAAEGYVSTVSSDILPYCIIAKDYKMQKSVLNKQGVIRVQSYASQAAIYALAPMHDSLLLDLCAAPGGKTLTAAQYMEGCGEIVAFDRHENRLKLLTEAAVREEIDCITTKLCDTTEFLPEYEGKADFVIADVPCSGFGQIHTKSELRLNAPPDEDILMTQRAILTNGCRYLKKGGRLVYSTCTINQRENQDIVRAFLQENVGYALHCDIPPSGFQNHDGYMLKLPSVEDGEGFFYAIIERLS
ncbi:MAG: 16S rRNA (cytosine(967)-C(5))-methyltransferase RsmB [Oscillospiraceae bacterium]|nr:16S rRNA (cytosine(967)-C(5))-methyltransferase RsmB [Oscillospiraceae bacterium]